MADGCSNQDSKSLLQSVINITIKSEDASSSSKIDLPALDPIPSEDEWSEDEDFSPPVKKKRGRPRKDYEGLLTQRRESQRERKCPEMMHFSNDKGSRKWMWSEKDKLLLLRGLEEFGSEDIEGLRTHLPHKKDNDIKDQVQMWKECAQRDLSKKLITDKKKSEAAMVNCTAKLEKWNLHFQELMKDKTPTKLFAISNVFQLIAEYGKFPSLEETEGVDFRAMYRYLHCILNGIPHYGINPKTAIVLAESAANLSSFLRERNLLFRLQPLLENIPVANKAEVKTYTRPKKQKSSAIMKSPEALMTCEEVNPLGLCLSGMFKPDGLNDDDDGGYYEEDN